MSPHFCSTPVPSEYWGALSKWYNVKDWPSASDSHRDDPKQLLVQPTRRQLFRIHWRVGLGVEMGWDVIICGGNAEAFCDHCEFDKWGAKSAGFDIQWILFIRPKKRNWVSIQKLLISTSKKKLGYFSELRTRVFLKYSFNRQIIQTQVERFTSIFPTIQTFGPWQIYLDLKYETSLKARFLLKSKISNNEKVKVWPQSLLLRNLVYNNDEKFQICFDILHLQC